MRGIFELSPVLHVPVTNVTGLHTFTQVHLEGSFSHAGLQPARSLRRLPAVHRYHYQ